MKPEVFNYADYERLKAENEALKAENEALKADLEWVMRHNNIRCEICKYARCINEENDIDCVECKRKCPCVDCFSANKFEWRGVSNDRT